MENKKENHHHHGDDKKVSKNQAEASKALKKLLVVSCLCIFFMCIEVVGGYLAHSIAIMSDAAHLLSDFSGFLISMFSIWIGTRPASGGMSFGYHRAEVIGALGSILLIWGLTAWLLTEATYRIIEPQIVDGKIMLITSVIGLAINLAMMKVLHSGPGHHHLGGGDCGHGHSHGESNEHKHNHDHSHKHTHGEKPKDDLETNNGAEYKKLDVDVDMKEGYRKLISDEVEHMEKSDKDSVSNDPPKKRSKTPNEDQNNGFQEKNLYIDEENLDQNHMSDSGTEMDDHGHHHHNDEENNINIRAAFIHLIGDTVQSIGVIIAAVVIYFKPEWQIVDPICTFLFSIFVILTTLQVTKDCIKVLMEAAPKNIKIKKIEEDLLDLKGVDEVHDIHVWSISMGKVALSAHITSEKPLSTLKRATKCMRKNYGITHTTIQVEAKRDMKHSFECSHDLHE